MFAKKILGRLSKLTERLSCYYAGSTQCFLSLSKKLNCQHKKQYESVFLWELQSSLLSCTEAWWINFTLLLRRRSFFSLPQTSDLGEKRPNERIERKNHSEREKKKKVNIKFNNVLVLISITMLSGSTLVFLTRGSGVKSLHLPAKGTFSQALLTITQLFAV